MWVPAQNYSNRNEKKFLAKKAKKRFLDVHKTFFFLQQEKNLVSRKKTLQ